MVQRGANYERKARDWYPTPRRPIELLLRRVRFAAALCDPCCGDGAMLRVFRDFQYEAFGCDIHPVGVPEAKTLDFLDDNFPWGINCDVVTNPPYGKQGKTAEAFIRRALNLTERWQGRVAMLLPVDFDSAATRAGIFRDMPSFAEKLVLLERIVWFPKSNGDQVSPSQNWAWFRWDWKHRGPTIISYLGG